MITDNTYYKGDIYIPEAKPSISDEVLNEENSFFFMLNKFEEDCLIKCLGHILYENFISEIDSNEATLLKNSSDEKWDRLLNGHTYTKNSKQVKWKGIRFKSPITADKYNRSFLANYVYFFYERKQYSTTTTVGTGKPKSENMEMVNPTMKVVNSWNEFVQLVQGDVLKPKIVFNSYGYSGVDFYQGSEAIPLYTFIKDMNSENGNDYYADFQPTSFEFINTFGL